MTNKKIEFRYEIKKLMSDPNINYCDFASELYNIFKKYGIECINNHTEILFDELNIYPVIHCGYGIELCVKNGHLRVYANDLQMDDSMIYLIYNDVTIGSVTRGEF